MSIVTSRSIESSDCRERSWSTVVSRSAAAFRSTACNSSVAIDKAGASSPDCSASDLCKASNIWLMFTHASSYRVAPFDISQRFLQIGTQIEQSLGGESHIDFLASFRPLHLESLRAGLAHHVESKIHRNIVDDVGRDAAHLPGITGDQRIFTDRIDKSRNSARMLIDIGDGLNREQFLIGSIRSCQLQPAFNVSPRFAGIKRLQMRAQRNSL